MSPIVTTKIAFKYLKLDSQTSKIVGRKSGLNFSKYYIASTLRVKQMNTVLKQYNELEKFRELFDLLELELFSVEKEDVNL